MIDLRVHYRETSGAACGEARAKNFTNHPEQVTCLRCKATLTRRLA